MMNVFILIVIFVYIIFNNKKNKIVVLGGLSHNMSVTSIDWRLAGANYYSKHTNAFECT